MNTDQFYLSGWELQNTRADAPAWFVQERVQAHTRLFLYSPRWGRGRDGFDRAGETAHQLGANVLTRHVKTGSEAAWWLPEAQAGAPAATAAARGGGAGRGTPVSSPAVVREMVSEAHKEQVRVIAYYWIHNDNMLAEQHPDWLCEPLAEAKEEEKGDLREGAYLDITSPYREVVLERLLELAEMGVDGYYFDHIHLPLEGCAGSAVAQAFERATGRRLDKRAADWDETYQLFLAFQAYKIEETYAYWQQAVKQRYPDVVFIVSTAVVAALSNLRMTTNLARIVDSPKSEFRLALLPRYNGFQQQWFSRKDDNAPARPPDDIRMALSWTLLRDSADNRPPHIWAAGFEDMAQTLAFVAATTTYGGIANVDISEEVLSGEAAPEGKTPREAVEAAFALGRRISPVLSSCVPLRWAAVHYSELARNQRGNNLQKMWREVLWPVTGAFGGFVRAGLPVGVVNDYQLANGQLDGYQVLFLPNPDELRPDQQRAVAAFEQRGGIVIRPERGWRWGEQGALRDFQNALTDLQRQHPAPIQVDAGNQIVHACAYQDQQGRLCVALCNDFSFVEPVSTKLLKRLEERGKAMERKAAPAPAREVTIAVRGGGARKIHEIISDRPLRATANRNETVIELPPFEAMALVVIEQ